MRSVVDPTTPFVGNLLLLDSDGKRIAVQYFSPEWSTVTAQANFEKSVYAKTASTNAKGEAEIAMINNAIVAYKFSGDLMFFVTGSEEENEIILSTVLRAFFEAISILLRGNVEKKTVLENLDLVLLTMDETVDGGIILETDPATIAARVGMRGADNEIPLAEQTLSQAFASAREQLAKSLLK